MNTSEITVINENQPLFLIDEHSLTPDVLMRELEGAGIDCEQNGENSIYVTGLSFNFWLRIAQDTHYLIFTTYIPLTAGANTDAVLCFVNELNYDKMVIQFFANPDTPRISGFYMLSYKGGMLRRQLLRMVVQFPSIFAQAAAEGRVRGLCDTIENETPLLQFAIR